MAVAACTGGPWIATIELVYLVPAAEDLLLLALVRTLFDRLDGGLLI